MSSLLFRVSDWGSLRAAPALCRVSAYKSTKLVISLLIQVLGESPDVAVVLGTSKFDPMACVPVLAGVDAFRGSYPTVV